MNDQPAFPVFPDTSTGHASAFRGMTLRDYFAAKAMQGYMYGAPTNDDINDALSTLAEMSYRLADAMMKAREA